jgi:hypothetical protein
MATIAAGALRALQQAVAAMEVRAAQRAPPPQQPPDARRDLPAAPLVAAAAGASLALRESRVGLGGTRGPRRIRYALWSAP